MTGGILQLVAKGVDDLFIIGSPEITYFKTIYRRHTNFSRGECDIKFQNKLGFGREAICKIQRWGDLLHRLFLIINLPKINLVFVTLTIGEVKQILADVDIIWTTDRSDDEIFDVAAFDEVSELIDQQNQTLRDEIERATNILELFEPGNELAPNTFIDQTVNTNDDVDEYYEFVIRKLFEFDQFELEYKFIDDHGKDRIPGLSLANSVILQQILFNDFVTFATGVTTFDPTSFNDENLLFFYNTDTANYNVGGSANLLDSNTVFRGGVQNAYGDTVFKNLDAFKIFDVTLNENVSIITSSFDIQQIKSLLLDNIEFGLIKNPKLHSRIYDSLADDAKFTFYRFLQRLSAGNYDPNSGDFINLSTVSSNELEFNDNFTSDFNLPPETGEPTTVSHPFSNIINTAVTAFHDDNKNIFRTNKFVDYFNNVNLWSRTDAGFPLTATCTTLVTNLGNPILPSFFNMYHLNFIPFLTNRDIPDAINRHLENLQISGNTSLEPLRTSLNTTLEGLRDIIEATIDPKICIENDYITIDKLSTNFRRTEGLDGDIMFTSMIRLDNFLVFKGNKLLLPDYIIERHIDAVQNFVAISLTDDIRSQLIEVINLFRTPSDSLASHTAYVNQGNNQRQDITINRDGDDVLSDVISSIWHSIINDFVINYNSLYDDKILGRQFYEDNIGSELKSYLDEISETHFSSPTPLEGVQPTPIDYYRDTDQALLPINGGDIGIFFRDTETSGGKIDIYEDQSQKFTNNRLLLDMKDLIVSKPTFYFEEFRTVLDFILLDQIEQTIDNFGNLRYDHEFHNDPLNIDPVIDVRESILDPTHPRFDITEAKNNAVDIILSEDEQFEKFITTTPNSFLTSDPNKRALWDEFYLPIKKFDTSEERAKHQQLFGNLNSQTLYSDVTNIDVNYSGFMNEQNIFRYMKDIVIKASNFSSLFNVKGSNIVNTRNLIVAILTKERATNALALLQLEGTQNGQVPGLKDQLGRTLSGGQPARFAWIKHIGHYIIESVKIKIGDQLIDNHTGEWLHIWHELTKDDRKERGYNKLIGNVPELYDFTDNVKDEYQLKIPLRFWLCNNIGAALPLVALQHSNVELSVKLKEFRDIAYFEPFTEFRRKIDVTGHILAEYMYVESDERDRLSNTKLEYIIDQVQFNGRNIINKSDIRNCEFDIFDNTISERLFFTNPCTELFWMLQKVNFTDGSMINGERKYHNYAFNFDTEEQNPAKMAKIEFSSRDRESYKDIIFYEKILPMARHHHTPSDGINIYSFALRPELIIPSGSANLSKLDDVIVNMILNDDTLQDMINNNSQYRWPIYAKSFNVLRIFSGMAGLAFFK
jgi:hypothetical protein